MELWALGIPGGEPYVTSFAPGNIEAMFVEDGSMSAMNALGASNKTFIVFDQQGNEAHKVSTDAMPPTDPANRNQMDAWVRALLP